MKRILKAFRSRDRDLGDKLGMILIFLGFLALFILATLKSGGQ